MRGRRVRQIRMRHISLMSRLGDADRRRAGTAVPICRAPSLPATERAAMRRCASVCASKRTRSQCVSRNCTCSRNPRGKVSTRRQSLTPTDALKTLQGKLWHTTSKSRFEGILKYGSILVDPPENLVPNSERWKTRIGPDGYSYVRHLGGVSLFDFHDFCPDTYDLKYLARWRDFVPICWPWDSAVWLEIDREKVSDALISWEKLSKMQDEDKLHRRSLMPIIEAAHLGDLPISAVARVLLCKQGWAEFKPIDL